MKNKTGMSFTSAYKVPILVATQHLAGVAFM